MKTFKAAIVGLALISGATLAHADVVADWNKTAIEVMKAVNVAGNPWTRTLQRCTCQCRTRLTPFRTDTRASHRRSQPIRTPPLKPLQQRRLARFSCGNIPVRKLGSTKPSQ